MVLCYYIDGAALFDHVLLIVKIRNVFPGAKFILII